LRRRRRRTPEPLTSPAGRDGTADKVAITAAVLAGPDAGFATGTELLIDGGVIAALAPDGELQT
jgi:NAD(P)-dependent dehydrogenase (short-subunit alcohol dehydrogenase family)